MNMHTFVNSLDWLELRQLEEAIHEKKRRDVTELNSLPYPSEGEINLITRGQWIEACKQFKGRVGCTLMQAKFIIDKYRDVTS